MKPEQKRRQELIAATLLEIGAKGTLNVTVSQIAKRAGVSPGLAFHYFGDKEALFLASMRSILRSYGAQVRANLEGKVDPIDRLTAILETNFAPSQFDDGAVAAWLNFYVLAQTSPEAQRLLSLYHRRFQSNLVYSLKPLAGTAAQGIAERLGGLVDGLYLRIALNRAQVDPAPAVAQVLKALEVELTALQA